MNSPRVYDYMSKEDVEWCDAMVKRMSAYEECTGTKFQLEVVAHTFRCIQKAPTSEDKARYMQELQPQMHAAGIVSVKGDLMDTTMRSAFVLA